MFSSSIYIERIKYIFLEYIYRVLIYIYIFFIERKKKSHMDLGSERKAMESELFRINTELEKTREGIVDVSQKIDHARAWFRDNVATMNGYRDAYNAALTSAHIEILQMPELSELNGELDRVNSFIIDGRGNRARRVNNGGEMQYIRPITQKKSLDGQWRTAVVEFCKDGANRSKYELFHVHCTRANELNVILVSFETHYMKNEKIVKEGPGIIEELVEIELGLGERKGRLRTMFKRNAESGGGHISPSHVSGMGVGDDMRDHGEHGGGGDMGDGGEHGGGGDMREHGGGGDMREHGGGGDMGDYDESADVDFSLRSDGDGDSLSVDNLRRAWGGTGEDDSHSRTFGGVMDRGSGGEDVGYRRALTIPDHDHVSSQSYLQAMSGGVGQTTPSIGVGSRHGLVSHNQDASLIGGPSLSGIDRVTSHDIGSSRSYLGGGFAAAGNLRGAISHSLHEMVSHNRDAPLIGEPSLFGIDRGTSHSIGSSPSYLVGGLAPAGNSHGPWSRASANIYDYLPDELGEFLQLMHDRHIDPLASLKTMKIGKTSWDSIKDLKAKDYHIHPPIIVGTHARAWDARFAQMKQKYINRLRNSKS